MSIVPLLLMILLANKTCGFNYTMHDIHKNNRSFWVIGNRVTGDELLVKDTIITSSKKTLIKFGYAVTNAVTCLEIWSERNLNAVTDFYYGNDLITGNILIKWLDQSTPINTNQSKPIPLKIHINIFGFNGTFGQTMQQEQEQQQQPHDNNLLRHKWHYDGILLRKVNSTYDDNHNVKARHIDGINDMIEKFDATTITENKMAYPETDAEADLDEYDNDHYNDDNNDGMIEEEGEENFDDDADDDADDDDADDIEDAEDYDFNQLLDKTIELGQRQNGDYLLYETYQTAAESSQPILSTSETSSAIKATMAASMPEMSVTTASIKSTTSPAAVAAPAATAAKNQSVVFYYIDSNFITYVKFIIYDHFVNNQPTSMDYISPVAECTHLSSRTLKAIITDHQMGNLFVQMQIYGYQPKDLPVDYIGFMANIPMSATSATFNNKHNSNHNRNGDSRDGSGIDDDDNNSDIIVIDANKEAMSPMKKLQILLKSRQEQQQQQQQQQLDEYIQGHKNLGQTAPIRTIIDNNYNDLCGEQQHSLSSSASSPSTAVALTAQHFNSIYSNIWFYTIMLILAKFANKLS